MATWVRLTNSALPSALAPNLLFGGESDPVLAVYGAYVSGAPDLDNGIMYFTRHGGHGDYASNAVYKFTISTGQWTRIRDTSTAWVPIGSSVTYPSTAYQPVYADGTPASLHTYDGECHLPTVNKILSAGGIYWSPGGLGTTSTYLFNLANNQWEDIPDRTGGSFCTTVWDPVTKKVFWKTTGSFGSFDPATNTWTTLYNFSSGNGETSNLALDPVGRRIYFLNKHSVAPFRIRMIDLNNLAAREQTIDVTGAVEVANNVGLSMVWDNDRIVAFGRDVALTGGQLFTLDPNNPVWVRQPQTNSANKPNANGMWKKFFKYNGTFYAFTNLGVDTIVPDWGASPTPTQTISVAGQINVNYQFLSTETPAPPPGPPGSTSPIPANTWTLVPALSTEATAPQTTRAGKHMRLAYDLVRERYLVVGGDRLTTVTDGEPSVETVDTLTGQPTLLSGTCTSTNDYMPNFPDNVPWVYDSRRDEFLMFKGFYLSAARSKYVTSGTVTPSATSGLNVPFVSSVPVFSSWMALDGGSGTFTQSSGFKLRQVSAPAGSTVIAEGYMSQYVSPTQMNVNISTALPFASTAAIAANTWVLSGILAGDAALAKSGGHCDRNIYAGDAKVLNDDCIFDPVTNKYKPKTWPTSPTGLGNDSAGPGWGVYHEPTDAVYLIGKSPSYSMRILHRDTNTWEIIAFGAGMPTGAEKTLVTGANSYRAQMVLAGDDIFFMSNKTAAQCLIRYRIPTKEWNAWAVPQTPVAYGSIPDDTEPLLCYDPSNNVLLHPWANSLTATTQYLYIFNLATLAWEPVRTVPNPVRANGENVNNGQPYFDYATQSMFMYGRKVAGTPGYQFWHYRYTSTG